MNHLKNYTLRVSGNEQINLIGGFHGTTQDISFLIATNNFREPTKSKDKKDEGFFGNGIYFTQYPDYGKVYAEWKETNNPCMLISWVMMGKPYPATEVPDPRDPNSLYGKGCKDGYDSHYAIVKKQGSARVCYPCKKHEKPDFDEIVVFSNKQILPRYLVYYQSTNTTNLKQLNIKYRDAKCLILWVDDNLSKENKNIVTLLKARPKKTEVLPMMSSSEVLAWLQQFKGYCNNRLRIITNRYRKGDGDENAAEHLVKSIIKQNKKWSKIPILVFCGNKSSVKYLKKKYKNVSVTDNPADVLAL
eukprot:CAMPEP_0168519800 /NCGR_PEP_ID=MMETSP0405-20121227/7548_1 /TAXON_ID=498012 /ORGANISM="Trichosphaerium sp, Strain Am-I-7 wt" /LENGTH=302 /DNA_ID=CAMNT_0008540441 /DNA_START=150 /DNA_END=1058 /DNA_ORIENTATION=+